MISTLLKSNKPVSMFIQVRRMFSARLAYSSVRQPRLDGKPYHGFSDFKKNAIS